MNINRSNHPCKRYFFACSGFSLILAMLISMSSAYSAERPAIDHLVGFFETVVFGSEIDDRMESLVIARWIGPLRIGIKGQASDSHIQTVRRHLSVIKNLTGVDIEKVNAPDKPENLTILFLPPEEMGKVKIKGVNPEYIRQIASPLSCYFLSFKKPPDSIVRGVIVVNKQRSDEAIEHCLLEELVQSMGLPNDTDMLRPSIFSDHDRITKLSRSDEILLRTLYDERMTEGLGREEALLVARVIITDWDQRLPLQ
ncbi:MAG: DUF2927 domain-containing protein [Rhodospirillales bacterium]|nr:DUF2927 domain-containing protein [Rhodospirillales bacterium]